MPLLHLWVAPSKESIINIVREFFPSFEKGKYHTDSRTQSQKHSSDEWQNVASRFEHFHSSDE